MKIERWYSLAKVCLIRCNPKYHIKIDKKQWYNPPTRSGVVGNFKVMEVDEWIRASGAAENHSQI